MTSDLNDQAMFDEPAPAAPSKTENIARVFQGKKTGRVVAVTIGAVVFVAVALFILARGGPRQQALPPEVSGPSNVGVPPVLSEAETKELSQSPEYQRMVGEVTRNQAAAALASGQSYQPSADTVIASSLPVRQAEPPQPAAAPAEPAYPNAYQPAYQPQYQQAQDPAYLAMLQRAQELLSTAPRERGLQTFVVAQTVTAGTPAPPVGQPQPGQPAAQERATQTYTLIGAGAIESVRIDSGINTDYGSEFAATLLTGRYAGARLVGTYQRSKDRAVLQVRSMTIPGQGVTVAANAVILDAASMESGTATDVDRKLFTKYLVKPLAAGVSAVGQAVMNSGSTNIIVGDTIIEQKPEVDSKMARRIVIGSATQQLSQDADALDTTPTVRVAPGTIAGVLFVSDVLYSPKQ